MAKSDTTYVDALHYPRIVSRGTQESDGVAVQVETLEYATLSEASEAAENYRHRGLAVLDAGSVSDSGFKITVQIDGTKG